MIDLADQHYPVDIKRAQTQLGWEPKHTLRGNAGDMAKEELDEPNDTVTFLQVKEPEVD